MFQVRNEQGQIIIDGASHNYVLHQRGTVTGAAAGPTGATGSVSLPTVPVGTYMIFTRGSQYHCITSVGNSGFTFLRGQGTTTFDWYAFGPPILPSNFGLNVWNADGTLAYNISQPPLNVVQVVPRGTQITSYAQGDVSSANTLTEQVVSVNLQNKIVAFSDVGAILDMYTGHPGTPSGTSFVLNERFYWAVRMHAGNNSLGLAGIRRKPNRGTLHPNVFYISSSPVYEPKQLIIAELPPI